MQDLASKRVCRQCLDDEKYLTELIAQDSHSNKPCNYCDSNHLTLSMETLAYQTDWLIENYYQVGGYNPGTDEMEGESLDEILGNEISPDERIIADLTVWLNEQWFDYSSHEHKYGDDPSFIAAVTLSGKVSGKWSSMEKKLRESVRFFNTEALETFDEVFTYIKENHPSAFISFDQGSNIFRARIFQSEIALGKALRTPEDSFGPPPSEIAPAGRMNARGISVFYGATSKKNAVSEVRPPVGSYVVVSEFKLLRTVTLLDLTTLGELTISGRSRFDPRTLEAYELVSFINRLSRKMVMPVVPELQESNYLLTQAIADYLSTSRHFELDGIMFPSAQQAVDRKNPDARNIILFHKSSRVKNSGRRKREAIVDLYETDETGDYFEPGIMTSEEDYLPQLTLLSGVKSLGDVLELNLDGIEIHEITGVDYNTRQAGVKHYKRLPSHLNALLNKST